MADDRVFAAAARYVQGWGAVDRIGEHTAHLGARCAVLIDAQMNAILGERLQVAFARSGVQASTTAVSGEVTVNAIAAYAAGVRAPHPSFVVGVGGGKAIDIAKGVAHALDLAVVTVPTIASNDSPASRAIAVYDDQHRLSEVALMLQNPACVVVDTEVIASAPARFLAAGIGDALAKHAEVRACTAAGGRTLQGTAPSPTALIIAEACHDILRANGVAAVQTAGSGRPSPELDRTVEAVVLLSALAFENGGLSVAHAVTRGLMATAGASDRLHGEHVAYGLMLQLVLEGASDVEVSSVSSFLRDVTLPRCLAELGASADEETLRSIAELTMSAPHVANFPARLDGGLIAAAMRTVEGLELT